MKITKAIQRKQRERFLVESFIREANLNATIVEEREAPDFILCIDGKLTGVEVTEIFVSEASSGDSLQAKEAISAQIARKAQSLYQAARGAPAHVSICFHPGMSLRNINRDKTAQALCDFVIGLDISVSQYVDWRPEDYEEQVQIPDEIAFIHALGVSSSDLAHWAVAHSGWVAPLREKPLQQRINEKAKRIAAYQNAISTNWLLIVADAMKPSSLIEAKSDSISSHLKSPFDRTFFYRYPDRLLELCL